MLRLPFRNGGKPVPHQDRRYRADATVTFLGLTIFSRAGVGAGSVRLDQSDNTDGTRSVALRFMAGSAPDRTRGLNRLGYIQEVVVERNALPVESAYFGFITSSPEKSLDQAKGALGPTGKDAVPYAAVEGAASQKSATYTLYNTLLPSKYTYVQCEDVVGRVRQALAKGEIQPARSERTPPASDSSPRTFLYAVRQAMAAGGNRVSAPFLYNGKHYLLEADKQADTRMGEQFASRKIPITPAKIMRLNGSIRNIATRESTPFKLWFEQQQDLPIRFEYKPRSFLNLAFEWVQL